MGYLPDEPRLLGFASNVGAPSTADRYLNRKGQPKHGIEGGKESIGISAGNGTDEERQRLCTKGADRFTDLAKHAGDKTELSPLTALAPSGAPE